MLRRCVLALALEALWRPNYPQHRYCQKNLDLYACFYEMDCFDIVFADAKLGRSSEPSRFA